MDGPYPNEMPQQFQNLLGFNSYFKMNESHLSSPFNQPALPTVFEQQNTSQNSIGEHLQELDFVNRMEAMNHLFVQDVLPVSLSKYSKRSSIVSRQSNNNLVVQFKVDSSQKLRDLETSKLISQSQMSNNQVLDQSLAEIRHRISPDRQEAWTNLSNSK